MVLPLERIWVQGLLPVCCTYCYINIWYLLMFKVTTRALQSSIGMLWLHSLRQQLLQFSQENSSISRKREWRISMTRYPSWCGTSKMRQWTQTSAWRGSLLFRVTNFGSQVPCMIVAVLWRAGTEKDHPRAWIFCRVPPLSVPTASLDRFFMMFVCPRMLRAGILNSRALWMGNRMFLRKSCCPLAAIDPFVSQGYSIKCQWNYWKLL